MRVMVELNNGDVLPFRHIEILNDNPFVLAININGAKKTTIAQVKRIFVQGK